MGKDEDERELMVLRRSRKAFLIEYVCGILLLLFLIMIRVKGIGLSSAFQTFILLIAALAFISPEISRIMLRYRITSSKISIIKGLLKQTKKNVHFLPLGYVPEINLKQSRIQRLLNYGTIFIHGSGENSFEIKEVDHPQKILELIEELIDKYRAPLQQK